MSSAEQGASPPGRRGGARGKPEGPGPASQHAELVLYLLLPILRSHAEDCLSKTRSARNFADTVRRVVTESLGSGNVAIGDIAAQLETSSRSLQRRLSDSGKTYQQVLGEARLELSQRYLSDPSLSLSDTALLLGYSDPSAFSRAFRRWTGKSPGSFRRNGG